MFLHDDIICRFSTGVPNHANERHSAYMALTEDKAKTNILRNYSFCQPRLVKKNTYNLVVFLGIDDGKRVKPFPLQATMKSLPLLLQLQILQASFISLLTASCVSRSVAHKAVQIKYIIVSIRCF